MITVNDIGDNTTAGDGHCTLREAIANANDNTDTTSGDCTAGSGEQIDTIVFDTAGTFATPQTITLGGDQLHVRDSVKVAGPGAERLTLDGAEDSRIFLIDDGSAGQTIDVEIRGLTLTRGVSDGRGGAVFSRGRLVLQDVVVTENRADDRGGGVYLDLRRGQESEITAVTFIANVSGFGGGLGAGVFELSSLVVSDSLFSDNRADSEGGGVWINQSSDVTITRTSFLRNAATREPGGTLGVGGGGIYAQVSGAGNLAIADSVFDANVADLDGGGVHVNIPGSTATTRVERNLFVNNVAGDDGGGLYVWADRGHTIVDSNTVANNLAADSAGGIQLRTGDAAAITLSDTTVSGNIAGDTGGGMRLRAQDGEGIQVFGTTVSGNRADFDGGGIWAESRAGSPIRISHSTVANHRADSNADGSGAGGGITYVPLSLNGALILNHSIVADNVRGSAAAAIADDLAGNLASASSLNLVGNGDGQIDVANGSNGNHLGTTENPIDPLLGPLADNGGPTETHALLRGSPAIDAGDPDAVAGENDVPLFDQRGAPFARVVNGRIDIGAYESRPPPADLTGDGFVDFDDLTLLLAHWDQRVSAGQGNLVDPLTTPVNFQDLTLLLAAWTGPGPVGAAQVAAVGGDDSSLGRERRTADSVVTEARDEVVMLKHNLHRARRDANRSRPAGKTYGRLQSAAVDRVMTEEGAFERIVARRVTRRRR